MRTHKPWRWQYGIALAMIAILVLSGCTAAGPAPVPTTRPPRLLEPTAGVSVPSEPVHAVKPAPANTGAAPTPQPARPVELAGIIDDLDDQGWQIGDTFVVLDPALRLTGTPERGAWVQVRGDDDDDDDGRIVAREATVLTTTAQVIGPLETVSGDLWTIGGVTVRVPATSDPPRAHGARRRAPR